MGIPGELRLRVTRVIDPKSQNPYYISPIDPIRRNAQEEPFPFESLCAYSVTGLKNLLFYGTSQTGVCPGCESAGWYLRAGTDNLDSSITPLWPTHSR